MLYTYADDPCKVFMPKIGSSSPVYNEKTLSLMAKMHKAIAVIQFKLEGAMIDRHPEWKMADRKLLHKIAADRSSVTVKGQKYPMLDTLLPTVDPKNPYALTPEEEQLVNRLHRSFVISDKLRRGAPPSG